MSTYILNLLLILCCILFFNFASNFADFVLYYSHDCHSPACLQWWRHPPQIGHQQEQTQRCCVAAQRWRFTVTAVSGHGPAMHSTRLHANAAAAAATNSIEFTATTIKLTTIACAHTNSNSSDCSTSCNVDVFRDHRNSNGDDGDGNRRYKGSPTITKCRML